MGRTIEVVMVVPAPIETVWDDLADLESHTEWMADAERIDFVGEQRQGVGTRMEVLTKVGPLRTTDAMEFVAWEKPTRMAIRHQGIVSGRGEFVLNRFGDDATQFTWREELDFPWRFGGPIGAVVAAPILQAIWRRNLRKFAERF